MAVKVQYPGVAAAVRADMQNLGMILRLMKRIAPGLDVKSTAEEIRSRIGDELDYELEAQNQRALARIFRGHPFIVVPDVVTEPLAREGDGHRVRAPARGFDTIKEADQATRDRVGEIVFRFYFGCMYRHRQFSRRPAPRQLPAAARRPRGLPGLRAVQGDAARPDRARARQPARRPRGRRASGCGRSGPRAACSSSRTASGPDKLLSQFLDATWWYLTDEEIELEPEIATQVMIDMSDPRSEHFGQMRHETLPADHIFGRRVEMLTLAVLGQLRAKANWHRIAREWIYGDEPVTELGRAETAFFT